MTRTTEELALQIHDQSTVLALALNARGAPFGEAELEALAVQATQIMSAALELRGAVTLARTKRSR